MVTCLYTPRPPLYSEVPRGHDLLSSCVHVSSLVFQYRVLPGLLLPSQSCLDGQVPFLIELLHPEIQWYQLCFHFLCSYVICFELCYLDANSFTTNWLHHIIYTSSKSSDISAGPASRSPIIYILN